MKFGSVCSGIEAASCAWKPLGWCASFVSEIDKFACAVLAARHPDVPNFGDMTKFKDWPDANINVLVGGTPCQSFSVAGLRGGLADPRGNLMLTYLAIAARYRPQWLVWENVPGVLSSNKGKDFASLLGGMAELGYGFAYRVLDAQYFHLAQRRERVFVVGCFGSWRRAAAVLFERSSLQGDFAPRRESGKNIAGTLGASSSSGRSYGSCPIDDNLISAPLFAHHHRHDLESKTFVTHALRADGFDASEDGTGRGTPLVPVAFNTRQDPISGPISGPLDSDGTSHAIAFAQNSRSEVRQMSVAGAVAAEPGAQQQTYVNAGMAVRRLTPRECERLQGFEDDYTLIDYRGKPAKDGPRYKALGNSMARPVMQHIGRRIQLIEDLMKETLEVA